MRKAYRYLALALPVLVVVQLMAIAVAVFGLMSYNDDHALPKKLDDSSVSYTGDWGFDVHSFLGMSIIPLVALALLIVAFFAKVDGGVKWAVIIVADVIVQVALAFVSYDAPVIGLLHGLNAMVVAGVGSVAAKAATGGPSAESTAAAAPAAP
jgi:hypothetical protein